MRWAVTFVLLVGACGKHGTTPDAGTVTLTVQVGAVNSQVTGNGIACGTDPGCGSGATPPTCSVDVPSGTHVSLSVHHPVCPPGGIYFAFGWTSPPCAAQGFTCAFEITSSQTISVAGIEASR